MNTRNHQAKQTQTPLVGPGSGYWRNGRIDQNMKKPREKIHAVDIDSNAVIVWVEG